MCEVGCFVSVTSVRDAGSVSFRGAPHLVACRRQGKHPLSWWPRAKERLGNDCPSSPSGGPGRCSAFNKLTDVLDSGTSSTFLYCVSVAVKS